MSFPSTFSWLKEKQNYRRVFCSAGRGSQHTHPVSMVLPNFAHQLRLTSVNVQNPSPPKAAWEFFFPLIEQSRKAVVLLPLSPVFFSRSASSIDGACASLCKLDNKIGRLHHQRKSRDRDVLHPLIFG